MFQRQATEVLIKEALPILREFNVATKLFPTMAIPPEKNTVTYYEPTEQDNTQYDLEAITSKYSEWITREVEKAVGVLQNDIKYTPHEFTRAGNDIFNMDQRKREAIEGILAKMEVVAIAGWTARGINSFAGVATTTTDMTVSINTTSYALALSTIETMFTEARADLKSRMYAASTKNLVVTADVMARFTSIFSTTDSSKNILSYLLKRLAEENQVQTNGAEFLHESTYLGSEAGTGATAAAFTCAHPQNFVLALGPLEVLVTMDAIKGVHIRYLQRCRPVFFEPLSVHYDNAVDITS